MRYLEICAAALLAFMLTFFSGFGLGMLLPAFALFASADITALMPFSYTY